MTRSICIGLCSLCGGEVLAVSWAGCTKQPVPACSKCGATRRPDGPIIQMERKQVFPPKEPEATAYISAGGESREARFTSPYEIETTGGSV